MEKEYFRYESMDESGPGLLYFSNITLKKNIGRYSIGQEVTGIALDYNNGILEIWEGEKDGESGWEPSFKCEIHLKIGKELPL